MKNLFKWSFKFAGALYFALLGASAVKDFPSLGLIFGLAFGIELTNFLDLGGRFFQKSLLTLYKEDPDQPLN